MIPAKFMMKKGKDLSDSIKMKRPVKVYNIDQDEDFSPCLEVKEEPLIVCPRCKKMKRPSTKSAANISIDENAQPCPMVLTKKRKREPHRPTSGVKVVNKTMKPYISWQNSKRERILESNLLDAATKFVSENPSFLVTLGELHRDKCNMFIPAKFTKRFVKKGKHNVKLQVEDRSWPATLLGYGLKSQNTAKFCGGWGAFAREHQLEKGDVCIFELKKINEMVFEVHMFKQKIDKDDDDHFSRMLRVKKIQKEMALRRANDYNPDEPHFVIAITGHDYLYVPSSITKLYLSKQPTHVMLQTSSNEEPWCVPMHYHKTGSRLQAGWLRFRKGHNLLDGDACVFVLKDSKVFLFDVVIYRAT